MLSSNAARYPASESAAENPTSDRGILRAADRAATDKSFKFRTTIGLRKLKPSVLQ